jgi:hypothetical protein
MKYAPHLLVSVFAVAVLCLAITETVSAQESDKYNFMSKGKNTNAPKREVTRPIDSRGVITAIQSAGDPGKRAAGQYRRMYYLTLFGLVPALIAGIIYWRLLRQKRIERELSDPMVLFEELVFVHQLSPQEKTLIQKISSRSALPTPLQLFVEPKFLLEAWGDETMVPSHPLVRRLLYKLFDIATEGGESSGVAGMNSETKIFYSQKM